MISNPASCIDHTLLTPAATTAQILELCEEAVEFGFAAVCVPPCHVATAAGRLYGSAVRVAGVVGFPCGYNTLRHKVQEAAELVNVGAEELDMVASIGRICEGRLDLVAEEVAQVVVAAPKVPVKVILECCLLSDEQKRRAAEAVVAAGAAFVKTSTGFSRAGATLPDVRLLAAVVQGRAGVKASGGIRTLEQCRDFLAAGATRIGTSSGVAIVQQWQQAREASDNV